jgi:hypothetical protein
VLGSYVETWTQKGSCLVSSIGTALNCESINVGLIPGQCRSLWSWWIMKSFLLTHLHSHWHFALTCTEFISSLQKWRQLVLVNCLKAWPGTMPWLYCVLCSGKFNVAYCHNLEWKLPTPGTNIRRGWEEGNLTTRPPLPL